MSNPLFSVGTSRGGTTFFARMLSLNPDVKMASDPFLPLFRSFRTAVLWRGIDPHFDRKEPLGDYYFSDAKIAVMKAIQESVLDLPVPTGEISKLLPEVAARMRLAAEEVIPHLSQLRGDTYQELFASGLSILEKAYRAEDTAWVGFNDNWVIEFLPILARAFPQSKCIVIIRDPRAAMASSMKLREKDSSKAGKVPLMYSFAHHWRKHAAFAEMLRHDASLAGRLTVVRYEDLVFEPERTLQELCQFLGVAYDPVMLDTDQFRPLHGNQWEGHSNFDAPEKGIYTASIDAWKTYLPKGTIEFIEFVCDPEMRLFGYEPSEYRGGLPTEAVMQFFIEDDARAVGWRNKHESWDAEHGYELFRKQALAMTAGTLAQNVIERLFLFPELYTRFLSFSRS